MKKYNYEEVIFEDVKTAMLERYTEEEIVSRIEEDEDEFAEELNDELWIDDAVTGNGSGSYFFDSWKAEEALCHNTDLLFEAMYEFGDSPKNMIDKGAEALDVTIRCYLLHSAIYEAIDSFK